MEHFCKIILKSIYWSTRRCHLKVFFSNFSSGGHFSNFGKGSPTEHFCEIILKSVYWSRRRCHLKLLGFFSIFSSGTHFVQWSETFLAILVEGHPKNISENLF